MKLETTVNLASFPLSIIASLGKLLQLRFTKGRPMNQESASPSSANTSIYSHPCLGASSSP